MDAEPCKQERQDECEQCDCRTEGEHIRTMEARTVADWAPYVASAALVLDRNVPGWQQKVSVHSLIMHSAIRCVLGQVYGSFEEAPKYMRVCYSAFAGWSNCNRQTGALHDAWVTYLTGRE